MNKKVLVEEEKMVENKYLCSTYYMDYEHPLVQEFTQQHTDPKNSVLENAVSLYYAVRDGFKYNPYELIIKPEALKASFLLTKDYGYCVEKSNLLACCCRSIRIESRLGFMIVRNHIGTEKLEKMLKTDLMVFHGYTEMKIEGNWVKATPAFNQSLCEKLHVDPLEFDGVNDSMFQMFNKGGDKYLEYVYDYGIFDDLPFEKFFSELRKFYPHLLLTAIE